MEKFNRGQFIEAGMGSHLPVWFFFKKRVKNINIDLF